MIAGNLKKHLASLFEGSLVSLKCYTSCRYCQFSECLESYSPCFINHLKQQRFPFILSTGHINRNMCLEDLTPSSHVAASVPEDGHHLRHRRTAGVFHRVLSLSCLHVKSFKLVLELVHWHRDLQRKRKSYTHIFCYTFLWFVCAGAREPTLSTSSGSYFSVLHP